MKSAITISLVPQAKGGPFVFWDGLADGCRQAAAFGFDAVEIFPLSAETIDRRELIRLLDDHKLRVAAVGTGAGWVVRKLSLTHPEEHMRMQARAFIREIIDLAGHFAAPAIIGSMQGRSEGEVSHQQAANWLGEALVDLSNRAADHGQTLLYEPLNRYETNLFNRATEAASFLNSLPSKNLRLLADLFHMNIEESSIPDALQAAGKQIGHIHFADSNRRAIGFGHIAVAPIIKVLKEIGYEGYLSAEVHPLPDSNTAARQTIQNFHQYAGHA